MKRSEARENIRGLLVFQYGVHDYFELLLKASRKEELLKEDVIFYNLFDKVIEGQEIVSEEKKAIREYVTYKHGSELRRMKECDNSEMILQIQNLDVKKL